jgi:hypothetical protein
MLAQPRKRYPSVAVCEDEGDGFREGLNPSYELPSPCKGRKTLRYSALSSVAIQVKREPRVGGPRIDGF